MTKKIPQSIQTGNVKGVVGLLSTRASSSRLKTRNTAIHYATVDINRDQISIPASEKHVQRHITCISLRGLRRGSATASRLMVLSPTVLLQGLDPVRHGFWHAYLALSMTGNAIYAQMTAPNADFHGMTGIKHAGCDMEDLPCDRIG